MARPIYTPMPQQTAPQAEEAPVWQYDDETGMPVRKGGVIMSDAEFENLKKILETN